MQYRCSCFTHGLFISVLIIREKVNLRHCICIVGFTGNQVLFVTEISSMYMGIDIDMFKLSLSNVIATHMYVCKTEIISN